LKRKTAFLGGKPKKLNMKKPLLFSLNRELSNDFYQGFNLLQNHWKSQFFCILLILGSVQQGYSQNFSNGSFTGTKGVAVAATGWAIVLSTPDVNDITGPAFTTPGYVWSGGTPIASPDGGTWQNTFSNEAVSQTVTGLTIGKKYSFSYYYATQAIASTSFTFNTPQLPNVTITGATGYTNPTSAGTIFQWQLHTSIITATATSATFTFSGPTASGYMAYDGAALVPCNAGTTAPTLSATTKSNVCPATTADISSLVSSTCPVGSSLEWHNTNAGLNASNLVTATSVAAGTYYPVCHDVVAACYSPTPATGVAVTINSCLDADGDGIADATDLDDDNDGILDSAECLTSSSTLVNDYNQDFNAYGNEIYVGQAVTNGSNYYNSLNPPVGGRNGLTNGVWEIANTVIGPLATGKFLMFWTDNLGPAIPSTEKKFYGINTPVMPNTTYTITYKVGALTASGFSQIYVNANTTQVEAQYSLTTAWVTHTITWNSGANTNLNLEFFNNNLAVNGNDFAIDEIKVTHTVTACSTDTDGDGIVNSLDLDSDGDGCSDAIEGAGTFTPTNLVASTMLGGNSGVGYTGTSATPVVSNLGNTVNTTVGSPSYGVPTIATTGQGLGDSQNGAVSLQCVTCTAGTTALTLSATTATNACPLINVDLGSYLASACPATADLEWHNVSTGFSASNIVSTPVAIAGTYYPVCHDATNNCYNPAPVTGLTVTITTCATCNATVAPILSATTSTNICPSTIAYLNLITASNLPSGTTLTWHAGTPATAANQISPGVLGFAATYYAAFKGLNGASVCFGPTTPVTVTETVCTPLTITQPPAITKAPSTPVTGTGPTDLIPTGGTGAITYINGSTDPLCVAPVGANPLPASSNLMINSSTGAYSYTTPAIAGTYYFCVKVCDSASPTPECKMAIYQVTVTAVPCNAGTVSPIWKN
jgi:hypothetical protein